jgi:hypothetical protein
MGVLPPSMITLGYGNRPTIQEGDADSERECLLLGPQLYSQKVDSKLEDICSLSLQRHTCSLYVFDTI